MATLYSTINQIGTYVYSRGYSSYNVDENSQRVRVSVSAVGEVLGSTSQYSSTCNISGAWQVSATLKVDGVSRSLGSYSGSGSRSHSVSSSAPYYIDRDGGAENHYDISKSTSAKTVTLVMTYKLWGSTTYTGSINISVPAKTKYTITYNANGGTSGSITSQSYYYGDSFTVSSSATPTRDGYTFLGWSVSSSATSATYIPGSTYSNLNSSATWYAVWEASAPTITYANAYRVASVGSTERMQNGTVGYIVFHRKGSAAPIANGVYATVDGTTEYAPNSSAKEAVVDLWFSNLDLDTEYQALLNVTDSNGTATSSVTIPKSVYPIDVDPMLERIDFGYDVNFTGNLTHNGAPVGGAITIDSELSESSVNPVQNRVLTSAINNYGIYYGTCTTAAATAAKVATLDNSDGFSLVKGVTVAIKFAHYNKIANPTLNVDGSGAKSIKRYGTTAPSTSATSSWNDNSVLILVYDGTYWQLTNWLNTTYSAMSVAEYEAGTSGTARLISPVNLKNAIQHWATGEANVQSDWNQTDSSADDYIKNKPSIPSGVSPYTNDPSMDGTASAGSSNLFARGDHVHPSDTSRVPTTRKINGRALSSDVTLNGSQIPLKSTGNLTIAVAVDNKVNKETGKGLSTNDYTTTEKDKLAGIATGAEVNVQADWNESDTTSDAYIQNKPTVPTKTSELTNDSGFIAEEADPTVPAWAKASTKPAYTASEIRYNAQVTVAQEFNNKVDKETGKGLSTNDYTTAEKNKLAGIAEGAEVNVQSDWNETDSTSDAYIANKPTIPTIPSNIVNKITTTAGAHTTITNATGNVSFKVPTEASHVGAVPTSRTVNGKALSSNITLKATDIHIVSQDVQWETVEQGLLGLNSSKVDKVTGKGLSTNDYTTDEKNKLAGIAAGAEVNVNADWNATSGDAEILNKPTIPSKTSDLTNDSGFITANDIPDEVFTAEFNTTTYEELQAAYNSGKTMFLNINGNHFAPLVYWDTTNGFVFINQDGGRESRYHCYSNGNWTNNYSNFVPTSRKINKKPLTADVTLTASDVGISWSQLQTTGVKIATIGLNGTTTDVYAPTSGGTITETDPVFTASPAYGITQSNIDSWNNLPSLITILETSKNACVLSVNGSTATLIDYKTGNAANFLTVFLEYTSMQDCFFGQVINGASDLQQAQARLYELAELDMTTQSLRLVSVDDGVIYTADLQDTGSGLTGTLSSQTIPTGGITTETDPTVPAWAKASNPPTYGADEISFSVPQAYEVGDATDVEGAIVDLDVAVADAKSSANSAYQLASNALPKSGGKLTGDLTLYVASGNSPGLIFQRGTLTDNYNDWKIYDKSGFLYFAQRGSGSSAFGDMGYIDTAGVLHFNIPWGNVTGKPTIPSKTSNLTNDSGYISEPTMQTLSVTSGGSGTWRYRTWPSGWQEAWYQGSIQFTAAASSAGGWYRSTKNFALPISFADNASILVSGAASGRVFTHGGIKTNGTQFEAQILGGAALAANTYSGWNVYVAGYGRS